MRGRNPSRIALAAGLIGLAILACARRSAALPSVTITDPPSGAAVVLGEEVWITSLASAEAGVQRVELFVNEQTVREDAPPSGNPTTFSVVQPWTPALEGSVRVSVVVYDTDGTRSDPAVVTLQVVAAAAGVSPTVMPDVIGEGGCTLNASYVADVTIPDNTELAPGTAFVKTWRIRNSGTCDWGPGFGLVFVSGDQMGATGSIPVASTAAGSSTDAGANMTAPDAPGTYRGNWRMRSDDGLMFGSTVFVQIIVPGEESTEEPSELPPAAEPSPPTNLQATVQADGSMLFTWNDAVGEVKYDYEIGFYTGAVGGSTVADLPADTTSHNGGTFGCGGSGSFTIFAIAEDGSEIGRLTVEFETDPCEAETITIDYASRGVVDSTGGIYSYSNAGDTELNTGLQAFVTFDLSDIPNWVTIESARLEVVSYDTLGDPFGSLGTLSVFVDHYGTLDAGDFTAPLQLGAIVRFGEEADMYDVGAQEFHTLGVSALRIALEDDQFQIRLQFSRQHTDEDGVADVVRGTYRLVVTYRP